MQYLDGCPNIELVRERLAAVGVDLATVQFERIDSIEEAKQMGFRGSPTILVDGHEAFADVAMPVGYACRLYATEAGREGAPSTEQLAELLQA